MSAAPPPALPAVQLALRVLLPFAAGYFLSYLYRTVNAILAPEIGRAIDLEPSDVGLMTGAYFLTFAAFQLPLGILLDRFGPRRVEATLLVFAALGAAAFALADGVGMLVAGRALVGFGVSACLMGAFKANVQWFPGERLALFNGITLSAGGLGAMMATAPVQAALAVTDWRGVYAGLAIVTLVAALALFWAVPERDRHAAAGPGLGAQLREIGGIFRDPRFLRVAPVTMLSQAYFMAVQGLWAGPWLRDVAGLSAEGSAAGLTLMAAAMAVGFLSTGAIAERLGRMGISTFAVSGAGMAIFWLASAAMAAGWTGAPLVLCVVFGFAGTSGTLMYAALARAFPSALAGRVTTSLNLLTFASAFLLQWGIGWMLGLWEADGAGARPWAAYAVALGLPLALKALAALAWLLRRARTASGR